MLSIPEATNERPNIPDTLGPPKRLKIAMALYSPDLPFDSRVLREARALSEAGHKVTVYCLEGSVPPDAPFDAIARQPKKAPALPGGSNPFFSQGSMSRVKRLFARAQWMLGYVRNVRVWGRWAVETAGDVDVWHVHDLSGMMAIVPHVGSRPRVVYDSHEIFVDAGSAAVMPGPVRRLLRAYERRLTRRADAVITVNEAQAEVLERRLAPRRTVTVRNCSPRWNPPDTGDSPLRWATSLPAETPLALYHGILGTTRGVEQMAEAILLEGLEDVHAVALGFGDRDQLDAMASEGRFDGRFHVLDAVPPDELLRWVAGADVDVIALQHTTLNHYLCTPNKLWESLAAGVPVVVSDFPVMRKIVLQDPRGPLGAVCDPADVESVAAAMRSIVRLPTEDRAALRRRCLQAAHERWNWETESSRMLELYADF
jgi:glycosyltransferase involved in cell wall biosynthesis